MSATLSTLPIVKTVTVRCTSAAAFRLFTADIGRCYPLELYSVHPAVDCHVEPHVGGRLYEVGADGRGTLWGGVLDWNPPHALAIAWQARTSEAEAQRVDVTFRAIPGGTEVRLVHAGWERLKVDAAEWRDKYNGGWVEIFEHRFRDFADTTA